MVVHTSTAVMTASQRYMPCKGAHYLNPNVRTVIDIGGQDIKAISIDENGAVKNFLMNDKCAAGTGRFLEMMAKTMEMRLG